MSVAVHVIVCGEPISHVSPPFGDVTVTLGAWLSIGTVAFGPADTARSSFEQSRSATDVIVTVPGPVAAALES